MYKQINMATQAGPPRTTTRIAPRTAWPHRPAPSLASLLLAVQDRPGHMQTNCREEVAGRGLLMDYEGQMK